MKNSITWIDNVNQRFWLAVKNTTETNTYSLAVYRILTGAFLLFISTPNYGWMADLPKVLFTPPILSLVNLFANNFPNETLLLGIDFILLITSAALMLGVKARFAALLFIVLKVFVLNHQYSFGKIDHEILLPAMLACMAFSGWGQKLALWPDKPSKLDSPVKTLSLLAVFICFGYFSAGFEKAIHWLNFDLNSNGSGRWFYNSLYNVQREPLLAPVLKSAPFWIFKIMDIVGVFFEMAPFAALLYSRKVWQMWLFLAAGFHLINLLFFNINFIVNGIVYLAFIDYTAAYSFIKKAVAFNWVKAIIALATIYAVAVRAVSIISLTRTGIIFISNYGNTQLYGMVSLWILICITILIKLIYYRNPALTAHANDLSA